MKLQQPKEYFKCTECGSFQKLDNMAKIRNDRTYIETLFNVGTTHRLVCLDCLGEKYEDLYCANEYSWCENCEQRDQCYGFKDENSCKTQDKSEDC